MSEIGSISTEAEAAAALLVFNAVVAVGWTIAMPVGDVAEILYAVTAGVSLLLAAKAVVDSRASAGDADGE